MKSLLLGLPIMIIVSCTNSGNSINVQDLNKQFITAWNNRDSVRIDSFFAADVQLLQADNHFKGKTEVVDKWVRQSLPAIGNLKTSVVSSDADNHFAYEGGTFSVDVTAPNQPNAIGEGNYVLVWKKQADNSWKISYIQLEDLPLQTTRR